MRDFNGTELAIGDIVEYWIEERIKRYGTVENLFDVDNVVLIRDREVTTTRFRQSIVKIPAEQAMLWKLENVW